jgi:hypothetical protein
MLCSLLLPGSALAQSGRRLPRLDRGALVSCVEQEVTEPLQRVLLRVCIVHGRKKLQGAPMQGPVVVGAGGFGDGPQRGWVGARLVDQVAAQLGRRDAVAAPGQSEHRAQRHRVAFMSGQRLTRQIDRVEHDTDVG